MTLSTRLHVNAAASCPLRALTASAGPRAGCMLKRRWANMGCACCCGPQVHSSCLSPGFQMFTVCCCRTAARPRDLLAVPSCCCGLITAMAESPGPEVHANACGCVLASSSLGPGTLEGCVDSTAVHSSPDRSCQGFGAPPSSLEPCGRSSRAWPCHRPHPAASGPSQGPHCPGEPRAQSLALW